MRTSALFAWLGPRLARRGAFLPSLAERAHWRAVWILAWAQFLAFFRMPRAWVAAPLASLGLAALFAFAHAQPPTGRTTSRLPAELDAFLLQNARSMNEASTALLAQRWEAGQRGAPIVRADAVEPPDPEVSWPRGASAPLEAIGPAIASDEEMPSQLPLSTGTYSRERGAAGRALRGAASAAISRSAQEGAPDVLERPEPSSASEAAARLAASGKGQPELHRSLYAPREIAVQGPVPAEVVAFFRSQGVGVPFLPDKASMNEFLLNPNSPKIGLAARVDDASPSGVAIDLWIVRPADHSTQAEWTIRALKMYQREEALRILAAHGLSPSDLASTPIVAKLTETLPAQRRIMDEEHWRAAWARDASERLFVSLWLELGVFFGAAAGVFWWTRQRAGELSHWAQTPFPAWVLAAAFPLCGALGALAVGLPAALAGELAIAVLGQPIPWSSLFWLPLSAAGAALLAGVAQVLVYSLFRSVLAQRLFAFPLSILIVALPLRSAIQGGPEPFPAHYDAAGVEHLTLARTVRPESLMTALASDAPWLVKLGALALSVALFFFLLFLAHQVIGRFERWPLQRQGRE